jgi:hypothetical protein
MNPNPLLDPLLCETVETHQQDLLETARVIWVSASDWNCSRSGCAAAFPRRPRWRARSQLVAPSEDSQYQVSTGACHP